MSLNEPFETLQTMQDGSYVDVITSPTQDTTELTLETTEDPVSLYPLSQRQSNTSTNEDTFNAALQNTDRDSTQNSISSTLSSCQDESDQSRQRGVRRILPHRDRSFAPLPDLRFEQSYLNSISGAKTTWNIATITLRDQVFLPLIQGAVWSLALAGWAHWNQRAHNSGTSVGATVRRWWYRTNKWSLPDKVRDQGGSAGLAASVGDVSARWNGGELWSFAD